MAKKASLKELLTALAKERGVDVTDIDKIYSGGGVKGRLEEGAGFGEAFKGAAEEKVRGIKKAVSKEGVKKLGKKAYMDFFSGDDIFSAYMRGRLRKGKKEQQEQQSSPERMSEGGAGGVGDGGTTFLKIIAKNSMSFHMMARDMNVMRQNIQKLVKIKAGPQKKGGKAYATGADMYFMKEDEKEAALEVQKQKIEGKKTTPGAPGPSKEGSSGGGMLDSIMGFFSVGFMAAIKTIFSPKMLGKIFSKVFLPITLIATLFSGIMEGWKRYQETGNLGEAIIAGLGGALKFLTFGLFGEEELSNLWKSVSNFLKPITDTIGSIFTDIKNFFIKLFGGKVEEKPAASGAGGGGDKIDKSAPTMPNPGDFIAGAMKAGGESDEKIGDTKNLLGAMQEGMQSGNIGSVISVAQEYSQKYPEAVKAEGASPGTQPTPAPEVASSSPTAEKEISPQERIKEIEDIKSGLDKRLDDRKKRLEIRKAENIRKYGQEGAKALNDKQDSDFEVYKQDIESAKARYDSTIQTLKASGQTSAPSGGSSGGAAPSGDVSAGGSSSAPAASASPSADAGGTAASGADVSAASSQVAEAQRMESAADQGSVINSPTTNNRSSTSGKPPSALPDTYDSELASILVPSMA